MKPLKTIKKPSNLSYLCTPVNQPNRGPIMDIRKRLILITRPVNTTSGARNNCAINVCLLINTVIKRYVYRQFKIIYIVDIETNS